MNAPCRDCSERHLGCHSDCPRYEIYKKDIEKTKEWLNSDKKYLDYCAARNKRLGVKRNCKIGL